ncbi:glycosyltransferase [Arthrobacter sp. H35-D1]|uniref:glycosyltransferase n=1 Tax=Arthrobacter sp. H35-D1 TaxID=3046202 RepID=UPI0024B87AB4|nr:glycosyltransferase [Arthrobacter sp. H35-D1]MDJ0312336.1 glycosyltransferase [Arthrobacter sp. H35-D1]
MLLTHPTAELYGSDRVFLESVSALVQAGNQVVVSLPVTGPLEQELHTRGARVELCPSPVLRKSMFKPKQLIQTLLVTVRGLRHGSRLIRQERPQLIYVNTMTIPLWNVLARFYRVPLVVHVHEGEASAGPVVRMALALPLFLARTTIANSTFSAGVIQASFKSLGKRIQVVYNAVPGPLNPRPIRSELCGPLRLAYMGRLSPRKGVDTAIDALALLLRDGVKAELGIMGAVFPGYEWYEQQLVDQIEARGLGGQVKFFGFQPSVWNFVADSDIVVVPSRADEPFGNTAVEAILGGRPVIASGTTGLIEATAGYSAATRVPPNDPAAVAGAVKAVTARWDDLPRDLADDLPLARQRHSIAQYQEKIVSIVEGCAVSEPAFPATKGIP